VHRPLTRCGPIGADQRHDHEQGDRRSDDADHGGRDREPGRVDDARALGRHHRAEEGDLGRHADHEPHDHVHDAIGRLTDAKHLSTTSVGNISSKVSPAAPSSCE